MARQLPTIPPAIAPTAAEEEWSWESGCEDSELCIGVEMGLISDEEGLVRVIGSSS
jgi:hypothetical protein